jgi:hypothetical protein
MTPPPIPISLEKGVLLEDSQSLLCWGASRDTAWSIGNPSHHRQTDDPTRIKWEENILGGLPCGLLAYLPDSATLDRVSIWLRLPENTCPRDARYQYCRLFDHLFVRLGQPHIISAGLGNFYAPILTWKHQNCVLQLYTGEHHGDFTSLEITHGKAPRFQERK